MLRLWCRLGLTCLVSFVLICLLFSSPAYHILKCICIHFHIAQMLLLYWHCSAWTNLHVLVLAVILEKCNWDCRWDSSLSIYSLHHSHSWMCIVMMPLPCLRFLSWNFLSSSRYCFSPFVSLSFLPLKTESSPKISRNFYQTKSQLSPPHLTCNKEKVFTFPLGISHQMFPRCVYV